MVLHLMKYITRLWREIVYPNGQDYCSPLTLIFYLNYTPSNYAL